MQDHDRALATAFDGQAAKFERSAVQSDPAALERLVRAADLPAGSLVLDAGCGPGLVSEALLNGGLRVVGVDLSAEMIERAGRRCAAFGEKARFVQTSLFDADVRGPFDAAISRHVLHHMTDPLAFVGRQVDLLRPGGVLVLCDHSTDPDPAAAAENHDAVERGRDHTHTHCLTPGTLVDLLLRAGLAEVRHVEEAFVLDFDEWFDRGTPSDTKENVRARLLDGPSGRGFHPRVRPDGSVCMDCWRSIVRGVKPR